MNKHANGLENKAIIKICTLPDEVVQELIEVAETENAEYGKKIIKQTFFQEIVASNNTVISQSRINDLLQQVVLSLWQKSDAQDRADMAKQCKKIAKQTQKFLSVLTQEDPILTLLQASFCNNVFADEIYKSLQYDENKYTNSKQSWGILLQHLQILEETAEKLSKNFDSERSIGRPSKQIYNEYIYETAKLYEKLSNKRYTILRHKNSDGVYECVTQGHKFSQILSSVLNTNAHTNKNTEYITYTNLLNACEKAVTRLNKDLPR